MFMRVSPIFLTFLMATTISAGFTNPLLGQERSPASSSRRYASEVTQRPIVVPASATEPFQITVADVEQEPRANEAYEDLDLKPLSQFRFQSVTEDVRPKDYFSNVKANSELPSVSSHVVTWAPAGMIHRPFYFEEHDLERCGQTAPGFRQPFVSGRKFFLRGILFPLQTLWNRPQVLEGTDSNECNLFDQ